MINIIKTSLQIEQISNINMYLYYFKKIHIFRNLSLSKFTKFIFQLIAFFMKVVNLFVSKCIYILALFIVSKYISKNNFIAVFIHIFIFLSFIGCFINAKITQTSRKKYYSIMLLNMDAKSYLFYDLFSHLLKSFIGNFLILGFLFSKWDVSIIYALVLSFLVVLIKIVGEYLSLLHYMKFKKTILNSSKIYFIILILFSCLAIILPLNNIILSLKHIYFIMVLFIIGALYSVFRLNGYKDYKLMYKRILVKDEVLISSINREELVNINSSDYSVDYKKVNNKVGVNYLNILFFMRHKSLFLKPIILYSVLILIIFSILFGVTIVNRNLSYEIINIILGYFPWIAILMCFINRGPVIVQAMFTNCDRMLLRFNFYRNSDVVYKLFKVRFTYFIKINMIPAILLSFVIGLYFLVYSNISYLYIFLLMLSIISLSIFFSVYNLVIYYLLQPYSFDLKLKSMAYQVCSVIVYFISYSLVTIKTTIPIFTLSIILFSLTFVIVSVLIVKKYADRTFRLKGF